MKIEVSTGELVDKVAILKVQLERLSGEAKIKNVDREFHLLRAAMQSVGLSEYCESFQQLLELHLRNWDLVERWNELEKNACFDDEYIKVTRASNECNRERFRLKSQLNEGSRIVEEKSGIYDEPAQST